MSSDDDKLSATQYLAWPIGHAIILTIAWFLSGIAVIGDFIYNVGIYVPPLLAVIAVLRINAGFLKRALSILFSGIIVSPIAIGIYAAIDGSGFLIGVIGSFLLFTWYYIPLALIFAIFNRPKKQHSNPLAQGGVSYANPVQATQAAPVGQTTGGYSTTDFTQENKTQFCPNCGAKSTSLFCTECGTKITD